MSPVTLALVSYGLGVVTAIGGFLWLNRNKADQVDKAEDVVRRFGK